jgi:hypothetical protein
MSILTVLSRWGGILTIIVLIITLLRQLIAFFSFLMLIIKLGIVIAFVGLFLLIIIAMLRGRAQRRREAEEI